MDRYQLEHSEQYQGFTIKFYSEFEHTHPRDSFDDTEWDIDELCQKIDAGHYVWFTAKVTASKNGIELASDYLGCCLYESVMEFVTDNDYYSDMKQTVVNEAHGVIKLLTEEAIA